MRSDSRRARAPRLVKGSVALAVMAGIALTPVALALSSTPAGALPVGTTETSTPSSSANPAVVGQQIMLSATVTPDDGGTPTGIVTFSDSGGELCTGTLDESSPDVASCSYTPTSANPTDSITAGYIGDDSYQGSFSPTALSQEVDMDGTSTALVVSPGTPVVGQSVTLTATVSADAPGSGTPTGTVTFSGSDGTLCSGPVTLSDGTASCSVSYPAVTTDNFTADYSGDSNFSSSSGVSSVTVGQASTSTAISPSDAAPVVGEQVTYTATVSVNPPGSGTPTGTVDFSGNAGTLCSAISLSGSTATCTTAYSAPGSDSVSATYSGDSDFSGSSSASTSVTIGQDTTTTTASASPSPSVVGQSVTLSATVAVVAPGAGTPTGTVSFSDGAGALCSAPLNASSPDVASCTYEPSTTTSADTITADYGGDANDNASSDSTTESVAPAATTTVLSATASPVVGQSVTYSATVAAAPPGSGTPTGTVAFTQGSTVLCAASPLSVSSPDTATCSTSYPAPTTVSVSAAYSGDANFDASSGTKSVTVAKDAVSQGFTSSANPVLTGQHFIVTDTVSAAAPGAGTPTGTVSFHLSATGATPECQGSDTVVIASGAATCILTGLPAAESTLSVSATYGGDSNFNAGLAASPLVETIDPANAAIAVASTQNPVVTGGAVSFKATISAAAPGSTSAATPTGTPTWSITGAHGVSVSCTTTSTGTSGTNETATCAVAAGQLVFSGSPYVVKVSYPGDANFNAGSASFQENVTLGTSAVKVHIVRPTSDGGTAVLTATVSGTPTSLGTPTGTLNFVITDKFGNAVSCAGGTNSFTLSSGTATCTTGALSHADSKYVAFATYAGSASYFPNTSKTHMIKVP